MNRAIFNIFIAVAFGSAAGALAPTAIHAASGGIQLADSHDTAQRRELRRLRDERQRALDKATESRQRRGRRTRTRPPKTFQAPRRLTLSLPPGWSSGEVSGVFKEAAIGDTPAFSKARTEFMVFTPGDGLPEKKTQRILLERFRKSMALSLEHVYRRWREKVNAGCADGFETGPDDSDQDGQAVIDSFFACAKRKADGRAQISMLKAIDGPTELFVISRLWLGPSPAVAKESFMEAMFNHWRAWSASATRSEDGGAPPSEEISKGYGFVVGRAGHLVTLHSLVKDCRGLSFSSLPAELVASDPDMDLALFKLGAKPKAVAVFRKGLEATRGDPVSLPSYRSDAGAAIELSVTTGVISALIGPGGDPRLLSVTAAIPAGNSGLPLVDLGGIIVGMAMARTKAMKISASPPGVPPGASFALSAKVLKRFLDRQGVVYETRNVGAILTPGEAAQRARSATVLVECRN